MTIHSLQVGQLTANCYLVIDNVTKHGAIIDPGDDADFIIRRIQDLGFKPQFITATHGHFDHIFAAAELRLAYKIPFLLHQKDEFLLRSSQNSKEYWLGAKTDPLPQKPDKFIKENDVLTFGNSKLKIIETPGHTPGSICLHNEQEGVLFCGDTIFAGGFVGRTDFSYGDGEKLQKSIKKLLKLPKSTKVYPGHGKSFLLKNN